MRYFPALLAFSLFAAGPVEVARVASYTEGVVFDRAGNAYFSHGKFISRLSLDGKVSQWAETGAPNGHKILPDGTHLVCDASRHAVLKLDGSGKVVGNAASECDGKPLRGPNDVTLDGKGGFYFTDPGGWEEAPRRGTLHYTDPKGITHLVDEGLYFPNGLVMRPDGVTLLVGESRQNRVLEYKLSAPGKKASRRVFADLPKKGQGQVDNQPDGMTLDSKGNLYVAHYGMRQVQVLSPKGKLLRSLPSGNLTTSNVAFRGNDLYVTGALEAESGSPGLVFRIRLD